MDKRSTATSMRGLAALFSAAAMLAACGGGDDPPGTAGAQAPAPAPSPSSPSPAPAADVAFATPMNATDTTEAAKVETYAYAEKGNEQTPGSAQFAAGAVTYGATLGAAQAYAGAALRSYAPGNTGSAPVAAFDATAYTRLRIELKSSTDAVLLIKLQPSPVAADGCTATAQALVSDTLSELVIDLDAASFPLPDYCAGNGSAVSAVKAGLYAVDVINPATGAGLHDLTVGAIKLAP